MADVSKALEATSLIVIMIGAFTGNITAITIILRVRSLRQNPHNLLILNLSVADLGVALTSMTFSLVSVFDGGEYLREHDLACKISGFFVNLFSFTHFMTIAVIAVDRVLIVTSSKALRDGLLRDYVMVATAWFIATIISLPPATDVLSSMTYIPSVRHCTIELGALNVRIFFSIIVFCFVIPTPIACYSIVAYTLWRQSQSLKECQMLGRRGRGACSGSQSDMIETTKYSESRPNSSSNLSGVYNSKSMDPADRVTPHDGGELSSVDALEVDINDDDVFENGDACSHELSHPHVSFPEELKVSNDRVEYQNRKDRPTSSSYLQATERHSQTNRKDIANRAKKQKRNLKIKKKNYIIQRRVSIMGGLLVLVLTLCWTPYVIVRTLQPDIQDSVGVFTTWLAYCITVIDPIIYAFMNQRARKELMKYKNMIATKLRFK